MPKILIVDDEPAILTVLRVLVTSMGHQVIALPDGAQALTALESDGPFDLVLSDLRMNPVSGFDVLKAVKEHCAQVPVILVTAFLSDENWQEAKRLGAFGGLPKPFRPDLLRSKIDAALSGAPPEE